MAKKEQRQAGHTLRALVRRKHHSENGATEAGQLVRGVLMALRDSDPTTISAHAVASAHDIPSGSVLPAGSSTILVRRPAPSASEADTTTAINSHLQQQQQQKAQRSRAESTPISLRVSTEQTCTTVDRSCAPSTISAPKPAAPTPKSISTTANTSICSNMAESISVAVPEQTSAVVMSDQAHRESRSESISLSISTQDNSQVSRNDRIHMAQSFASMSPDVASAAAHSSAAASSKSSKRSSRLFGKLVPKFLQTSSLGPAGGSSSPKSAYPASSTPLSAVETAVPPMLTRQGRSASFAGGASSPMVNKKASQLPALPALDEKLTLPSLPALSGSTLNLEKEWLDAIADPLKTQTTTLALSAAPVSVHGTGLSANSSAFISTNISGPINNINSYSTAAASPASSNLPIVSSFTSPAPSAQKTSFSATDASYPPLHERPQQQSVSTNSDHKVEISNEAEVVQKERFQEGEAKEIQDHASHSPYIIDENCDDDFFLNSVLRKKHSNSCHHSDHNHNSNKSNDAVHSTRPQLPHALSAPYQYGWSSGSSSGSGNGNSHGIGRTPSLSTSFSSSSQASSTVPSPTTPMFVAVGLDEKRSRLSDAVKEWRRSTNAPSGPCNSANVF
ncbi:hypothetical protein EDD11_008801 [Mortierella claussenii]|nr:hypothetical protein EDD11_008801 [Mortierella claussenii]